MKNIVYLTPIDQLALDPFGNNRKSLKRFFVKKQTFNPKNALAYLAGHEYCDKYAARLKKLIESQPQSPHNEYYQWSLEYVTKYGPQGGTFPFEIMVSSYDRSYENASQSVSFHYAKIGAEWLARYCSQLVELYGSPVNYSKSTTDTNAALPTGLKKGTFLAEAMCAKPHRHLLPNLPGQRFMRKKFRTINQDACVNVRYTERILSACRNFLKAHIPEFFASWCNPQDYVAPIATSIVDGNMYSVETDYEKMDEHFGYDATVECVLPIYKALLPFGEYIYLDMMVSEMYDQPIYFGNFMTTGRHNLLSGQNPTNDFETLMQVCQSVGILLSLNYDPLKVKQLHLGDDQVVAFKTLKEAKTFMDMFIMESNMNGLLINSEKSTIRHGRVQYCRKLYYPRGNRAYNSNGDYVLLGAYPSILCLNTIINPERLCASVGIEAVATYQKLDNCIGSPDFEMLCQFVGKYTDLPKTDIDMNSLATVRYLTRDWWYKLYGEIWSPTSSPSFNFLLNQGV